MTLQRDTMDHRGSPSRVDDHTLRAARRFLEEIRTSYPVREACLFGSRARRPSA